MNNNLYKPILIAVNDEAQAKKICAILGVKYNPEKALWVTVFED